MAINFPSSPTTNDEYTFGGRTYVYDGEKWAAKAPTLIGFDDLANVTITSNSSGELPMWNGTAWVNQTQQELSLINQGKHSIYIPAAAMLANSGGNSPALVTIGTAPMIAVKKDPTTNQWNRADISLPKSWNAATLSMRYFWGQASAGTGNVVWTTELGAWSDGDTLANSFDGLAVTDAGGTAGALYITAETSSVSWSTTSPASGDLLRLTVGRAASDAGDTLAVDAYLFGIMLYFTVSALNDA